MGRLLSPAVASLSELDILVPVASGGLGADNPTDTAINIDGISTTTKGIKNGVVNLDSNGKIPVQLLPESSVKAPTLNGPSELVLGVSAVYTISNFDSKTTYTVTASAGTATVNGNLVTVTASGPAQSVTLIINNRSLTIPIVTVRPKQPTIAVKDYGVGSTAGLIITGATFSMLSGGNTHKSTDWEVSLNSNFSNTVFSNYNNQVDKVAITANGLIPGVNYFVRARYRDSLDVVSSWSKTYSVKTKTSYTLSKEIARLIATDRSTLDNLGFSVTLSGDGSRAAVSANLADVSALVDTGAVYIYVRSGLNWKFEAKLAASDKLAGDKLGTSISMDYDGTRVAVGSIDNSPGGTSKAGAVYVFIRSGVTWIQETKIFAADKSANDSFGSSVRISNDGTRLAIGTPLASMSAKANAGAVYVYLRTGVTWAQEAKFTSSDIAATDNFGSSVSFNSDASRLVIGAPKADNSSIVDTGSAYVFLRTGVTWAQEAKLVASSLVASSLLGASVAINADGTRAIVGAPGLDNSTDANTCAAYVYLRTGVTWSQETKLQASDKIMGDQFGAKVAINANGDRVAIGAKLAEVSAIVDAGGVYIFARTLGTWTQEAKVTAGDKATSYLFGSSVSLSSDGAFLVVGSNAASTGGTVGSGQAYVFTS